MRYDLIIFDNDGVLVDSETISNTILAAYLTELGHPTTFEESVRDYMGAALHRVHDLVLERSGRRLPDDFDDTLHARIFETFRRELKPVDGVVDVLDRLVAAGVPFCVASSGAHERIRVAHRAAGLDRYFPDRRVFSAEDVGRGKPAPDLFLHTSDRMGVEPARCAVIEDSPLGVTAANAARMDVYGFTAMTPPEKLAAATVRFRAMGELLALLDPALPASGKGSGTRGKPVV